MLDQSSKNIENYIIDKKIEKNIQQKTDKILSDKFKFNSWEEMYGDPRK